MKFFCLQVKVEGVNFNKGQLWYIEFLFPLSMILSLLLHKVNFTCANFSSSGFGWISPPIDLQKYKKE